jgi:hypothetical protein
MRKSAKAIFWMGVLAALSCVPIYLSTLDVKLDVYLLYDHERYVENIGYDVLQILTLIILTHQIRELIPERSYKRYATNYLIVAWCALPAYFLLYSQYFNLVFVPILGLLLWRSYLRNSKSKT